MQKQGQKIYLRARHPDIEQQPVVVQFFADGNLVETARLSSKQWQLVSITQDKLRGSAVLSLDVSRTWNPDTCENCSEISRAVEEKLLATATVT